MLFSPIKGEGTDSTNSINQAAQAWSSAASNTLLKWERERWCKVFYCAYNQTNKVLKNCYIPSLRSLNSLQMFYSLRSLQKCAYLQIPQFRMQALFSIGGKCKNPAITISRHFGISQTIFSIQTQTTLEKQKLIVWQFERGSSTKRGWWKHCWGEESPRGGGKPGLVEDQACRSHFQG